MEVRIGVQHTAREIVIDSGAPPEEVEQDVAAALESGGLLTVRDERGRKVIVPADRLAYVDISPQIERRVGFGTA